MPEEEQQPALFTMPQDWEAQWEGMPDYQQKNMKPSSTINVQFQTEEDRRAFLMMLGEEPSRQKSIWFPQLAYLQQSIRNAAPTVIAPGHFPVYVISKGRWETRLTGKALDALGLPYTMVIEPQEYARYAEVMDAAHLQTLPFSNLGQGSIPARNWVWDHAARTGAAAHWILDDNTDGFYRLHNNLKTKVIDEHPLRAVEDFLLRYSNVALAGLNYEFFADRRGVRPPFYLNTRVYSCILVNHALPHRWRGRYNEDTDLSLRALKDGWCTVLFNAYLCKKMPTMSMAGGNTDQLYHENGRLLMAQSLQQQHPDVVVVSHKWGRPQHHVNYKPFKKNQLRLRTSATQED